MWVLLRVAKAVAAAAFVSFAAQENIQGLFWF